MATPSQYLENAARYIGVSGTDNIFNTWYWGHPCYDPNLYPWCATFQSYNAVHDLKMPLSASAAVSGIISQCTRVADEDALPGDYVAFNWDGDQDFSWADHIGVCEWLDIKGSGYFGTIEGNTNTEDGEVARCTRYNFGSYATAFFRPPYSNDERKDWPVQMYQSNGTKAQKWTLKKDKDGYYTITALCNGYCLDVIGAGKNDRTRVQSYKSNGTDAQKWMLKRYTETKDGSKFNPPELAPWEIIPKCAPNKRLDVSGGSDKAGATVQIYEPNKTTAQMWYIVDNADGTFTIVNNASGSKLAIDVVGAGK